MANDIAVALKERKRTTAQCSWHGMERGYTYVCAHSAAAEAVTLIAVFSNSKELLPVPSVGTRRGRRHREPRAYARNRASAVRGKEMVGTGERRRVQAAHHSRINPPLPEYHFFHLPTTLDSISDESLRAPSASKR